VKFHIKMKSTLNKTLFSFSPKGTYYANSDLSTPFVNIWETSANRRIFQITPPNQEKSLQVTSIIFNHVFYMNTYSFA